MSEQYEYKAVVNKTGSWPTYLDNEIVFAARWPSYWNRLSAASLQRYTVNTWQLQLQMDTYDNTDMNDILLYKVVIQHQNISLPNTRKTQKRYNFCATNNSYFCKNVGYFKFLYVLYVFAPHELFESTTSKIHLNIGHLQMVMKFFFMRESVLHGRCIWSVILFNCTRSSAIHPSYADRQSRVNSLIFIWRVPEGDIKTTYLAWAASFYLLIFLPASVCFSDEWVFGSYSYDT